MSRRLETGRGWTLRGLLLTALTATSAWGIPAPLVAQAETAWRFEVDPFAQLWFHGLALVGFDREGPSSLYREGYAWQVMRARSAERGESSKLDRARGALAITFASDPAFEVLHFVPLYFAGVSVEDALNALDPTSVRPPAALGDRARRGADAIRHLLERPSQRDALATFVDALRSEPRPGVGAAVADVERAWGAEVAPALEGFIQNEGFASARILLVSSLGREGRYLDSGEGPIVAVGASAEVDPLEIVASLVRELCFPTVRRAMAPYEARLDDRRVASNVSDQVATRCGALLVTERAPALVEAYRGRFGNGAFQAAFLSTAGFPPTVAALERTLDGALRRELNLNKGSDRALARSSGR